MNNQQSNREVRFEDIMLETAWVEVENTFKEAGQVAPLPGFTSRFMARLEMARQREERLPDPCSRYRRRNCVRSGGTSG
jgi:hypothetical protein